MPNNSYLRGRRLEYALCKLGRDHGWSVIRASGSHGFADVIWHRETDRSDKVCGTFMEGLELLRTNGWFAEPHIAKAPDPFLYGFYRYTKGTNKHWIWVLPVDDGMNQVLFIQAKTRLGKKKGKKHGKRHESKG